MGRIDLAVLDTRKTADAGVELQLKHPATGEPLEGWVLMVRGYDANIYQKALDNQQRRRLERLAGNKRPTVEEMNADSLELAGSLVAGWGDGFDLDGAPFPYTEGNAAKLLARFPWIREQVERLAGDRGNFIKGSASS